MKQYIKNENNTLILYCTDKNGDLKQVKLTNYSIESLFIIRYITNTKNQYKTVEKRVLRITKEYTKESYIKILDGNDEIDKKSFFSVIHKDTIGLVESFNSKTFFFINGNAQ